MKDNAESLTSAVRQAEHKLLRSTVTGKSRDNSVVVKLSRGKVDRIEFDKGLKLSAKQEKMLSENLTEALNAALRKKQAKTTSIVNGLLDED